MMDHKIVIAHLSTFPPRACGIATFCFDLVGSLETLTGASLKHWVIAIENQPGPRHSDPRVWFTLAQDDREAYVQAARRINASKRVALVNIQHEFGIFGGPPHGAYLLDFLTALKKPALLTLHTILPDPSVALKELVQRLAALSSGFIVMTETSKEILGRVYGIPSDHVNVIPHGIHPTPFRSSKKAKSTLGLTGRRVLLIFGFLSRNKGIEYVLRALPRLVQKYPDLLYLIIGTTHPVVALREGESYRHSLESEVRTLGLEKHVAFHDRYFSVPKLLQFLEAADVYIASSLDPHQAVSGTFSYALGIGRPVIATSFVQAEEYLARGGGILVPLRRPAAFAEAIEQLFSNENRRRTFGYLAYVNTRHTTWPNVALQTMQQYIRLVPNLETAVRFSLPNLSFTHFKRLTTPRGLLQFSHLHTPALSSGYTVDDNARALVVAAQWFLLEKHPETLTLIDHYLLFLEASLAPQGGFYNMALPSPADHHLVWRERAQDADGRALAALAYLVRLEPLPPDIRRRAARIFRAHMDKDFLFTYPKSLSFWIHGLHHWLQKYPGDKQARQLLETASSRLEDFWRQHTSAEWTWFWPSLTYANAILPQAMLLSSSITGNVKHSAIAFQALDFLLQHSFKDNVLAPIGQNGWFPRGGERQLYDQQPEEAGVLILALKHFSQATGEIYYQERMRRAFEWFLGRNTLGQVVYDASTGGCYDGLRPEGVNLNQGAESTLMYLLARLAFKKRLDRHIY